MRAHNNNTPSNANATPANARLLPDNVGQALKFLVMISEKMVTIGERETQLLLQGDLASFSILQNEKEAIATRYARASKEFRERLAEFRGADQAMLTKLENLQRRLGEITHSNRDMIERMFKRSSKKTHESLITVQELAQKHVMSESNTEQTGA